MNEPTDEWIRRLPKAEVHLHLEGCVPYELAREAAGRRGVQFPGEIRRNEATGEPTVGNLDELLAYLDWACSLVDRTDQLEAIARGIGERAAASGALHVDVIFNPTHWGATFAGQATGDGGGLRTAIEALDAGFAAGEQDFGVTATLCASLKRDQSRSAALELVDLLLEWRHPRVSALSIDGNEQDGRNSNNERFAPAFLRAAEGGLRRCAHAGESSGAVGVQEAIEILGAERIDHGVRCLEDSAVVELVREREVPLDVCPTSNVILGVAPSLEEHPLRRLNDAGVRCSLNTDDPLIYGIDLAHEYRAAADELGFGADELGRMARVGIESCFAGDERKFTLLEQLDRYLSG